MGRHCLERVLSLKDHSVNPTETAAVRCLLLRTLARRTHAEKRGAGTEGERYSIAVCPLPKP